MILVLFPLSGSIEKLRRAILLRGTMAKIEIDDDKYSILEARAGEKDFEETEEYISYLLDQIVEKIKREKQGQESYSEEEEEKVKSRLEDLGYLD